MISHTFINDYSEVNNKVNEYFKNNVNTFVDNKHSFNQLQKWFINDDKKLIIVYKNYFTGDTIEEITDIL
jgi:hypothetical protein